MCKQPAVISYYCIYLIWDQKVVLNIYFTNKVEPMELNRAHV